jgi:hypothetical protein
MLQSLSMLLTPVRNLSAVSLRDVVGYGEKFVTGMFDSVEDTV